MLLRRIVALLAVLSATLGTVLRAQAQDAEPKQAEAKRPANGYWSEGDARWFLSTRTELGVPYAKPTLSAGYGMPHWIWTGVDVNAISTLEFFQAYAGVRAALPVFDLAFGMRDTWSYGKPFLQPAKKFTSDDVSNAPGKSGRYLAYEAEAVGTLPLPASALVADFVIVGMMDVPKGVYVYDESYRVIVADSTFFVLRMAAVARFLHEESLKVGVLVEYLFGMGRDRNAVRLGPAASLQLTDHLEINLAFTALSYGPDELGLQLGSYGVAGVRYRWATGERDPKLPWAGHVIP